MPLFLSNKVNDHCILAVWKAEESEHFFFKGLPDQDKKNSISHPTKRLESIAGRFLVQQLVENLNLEYQGIYKDEHGKPHLIGDAAQISITHAFPFIGATVNTKYPTGIDLESPKQKILGIQHKFLTSEEQAFCNNDVEQITLFWAAKEAAFKYHGRKTVSLKENISIILTDGKLSGTIIEDNTTIKLDLVSKKVVDHTMVYVH